MPTRHVGENPVLKKYSCCYKFKYADLLQLKLFCIPSIPRNGALLWNAEVIFIIYHSTLYLQNWFVYDKLPTNLAAEKRIVEFQNNLLPLAENFNSYCQVRFLHTSSLYFISKIFIYVIQITSFGKLMLVFPCLYPVSNHEFRLQTNLTML